MKAAKKAALEEAVNGVKGNKNGEDEEDDGADSDEEDNPGIIKLHGRVPVNPGKVACEYQIRHSTSDVSRVV